FALQFAVMAGAEVFATSSSPAKLERLKALGAAHGVNYREDPDWGSTVLRMTGGRGIDHVVEVGGAGTLKQSMRCLALGGTISMIGVVAGPRAELNVPIVAMQDIAIRGVTVGPRSALERLVAAAEQHRLKPVIDRTFPLSELRAALEYLESGQHFGKVCIEI
ncbi:MAG TPA: NAD(P)-dependent alcohol dehydrogenase, partial [Paracoccaceae bacterium]|nr:NAD(P)-dependent alcohol dehydrogenase [Paracoccaceae bacterium]